MMSLSMRRLLALLALLAAWLLLSCAPALAHASLVETYPVDGDILGKPPEQVQLLYSEPVDAGFDPVKVYDREGYRVDEGNARVAPDNRKLLVVDLDELSESSYTVEWRVTSVDGHPVDGEYGFDVDPSAVDASAGDPIESVERSAEQKGTGSAWGTILAVTLSVLLVGALVVVGLVGLRRRKGES
jgi:methionine-rich copper-binding protein CopC